jgi:hypothetical protein
MTPWMRLGGQMKGGLSIWLSPPLICPHHHGMQCIICYDCGKGSHPTVV